MSLNTPSNSASERPQGFSVKNALSAKALTVMAAIASMTSACVSKGEDHIPAGYQAVDGGSLDGQGQDTGFPQYDAGGGFPTFDAGTGFDTGFTPFDAGSQPFDTGTGIDIGVDAGADGTDAGVNPDAVSKYNDGTCTGNPNLASIGQPCGKGIDPTNPTAENGKIVCREKQIICDPETGK